MILKFLSEMLFGRAPAPSVKPEPPISVKSVTPIKKKFVLDKWIEDQKKEYGSREGLSSELQKKALKYSPDILGLSGPILDELINKKPILVPKQFWGGPIGWRSPKKKKQWQRIIKREDLSPDEIQRGLLVRFHMNAKEWVPHPYVPPTWVMCNKGSFYNYIAKSDSAYDLCIQWQRENKAAITKALQSRLTQFSTEVMATYACHQRRDYAEVAFILPEGEANEIVIKHTWKNEAKLSEMVKHLFPDAIREYSPAWLGSQRIDIYIPSLRVAIEYQGQQHYEAVDFFGGRKAFQKVKKRDERKTQLCRENNVSLIEWKYTERINKDTLQRKLEGMK